MLFLSAVSRSADPRGLDLREYVLHAQSFDERRIPDGGLARGTLVSRGKIAYGDNVSGRPAFARVRIATRSVSMRSIVFAKQSTSARRVVRVSFERGTRLVDGRLEFDLGDFDLVFVAVSRITGQTGLELVRPDLLIAFL